MRMKLKAVLLASVMMAILWALWEVGEYVSAWLIERPDLIDRLTTGFAIGCVWVMLYFVAYSIVDHENANH